MIWVIYNHPTIQNIMEIFSHAESYEYDKLNLVTGNRIYLGSRFFGISRGTRGHFMDSEKFSFLFKNPNYGVFSLNVYDIPNMDTHYLPDENVSHLSKVFHYLYPDQTDIQCMQIN